MAVGWGRGVVGWMTLFLDQTWVGSRHTKDIERGSYIFLGWYLTLRGWGCGWLPCIVTKAWVGELTLPVVKFLFEAALDKRVVEIFPASRRHMIDTSTLKDSFATLWLKNCWNVKPLVITLILFIYLFVWCVSRWTEEKNQRELCFV